MIFETNISDYYKVVQSSDECCYKYILGKLQEAKEIYIMAFGKSQRNIQLMDSLKSLKGKITVISDIDTIKGENIKRINKINSSFNLDKNSKIIMTERAAFIGAEEGSFSTGFLTIDSDVVDELRDNLFTEKGDVYKGYEFTKIEIIFMNYYSKINRIIEDIISGAFKEDEKGNGALTCRKTAFFRQTEDCNFGEKMEEHEHKIQIFGGAARGRAARIHARVCRLRHAHDHRRGV